MSHVYTRLPITNKVNPVLNLQWKIVKGYEDKYQVSNDGQIKSLFRYVPTSRGNGLRPVKEKIIAQVLDGAKAYLQAHLWKDNKGKTISVHTLVATAFCIKQEHHTEVNHIDGNKLNNNAYNLEWCTRSENLLHAHAIGLVAKTGLSGSGTSPAIGRKWSNSSKYYNVSFDRSRNRWIGGIKHNGKTYKQKRFKTELEAALYVDLLLDEVQDTIRPKNSTLINA